MIPIQEQVKLNRIIWLFCLMHFFRNMLILMRNTLSKIKHDGIPIVMAPIILYSDDTSCNRSKKWNNLDCWCTNVAGLPVCEASKIENIHFLSCSNRVSVLDMHGSANFRWLETVVKEGITIYYSLLKEILSLLLLYCAFYVIILVLQSY